MSELIRLDTYGRLDQTQADVIDEVKIMAEAAEAPAHRPEPGLVDLLHRVFGRSERLKRAA